MAYIRYSIFHFFFGCPSTLQVWSHFLPLLIPLPIFNLSTFLSKLCHSLQTLPKNFPQHWPSDILFQSLSLIKIVLYIIQTIWTHHWTNIFYDVPLHRNTIIPTATNILNQLDSEPSTITELHLISLLAISSSKKIHTHVP